MCVEKHGWILHIGKKKRNGEVANVYGLVMKREKNREMHHQSAKAKLLSLGGKTKEMSAIFTSIGSDRDNCCASSRSKMDAAYKWRKQIKATAADDGLHMPTKGAENRKTVCESSLRSTPSRLKNTNSFYFDLSLGHRLAKEK